MPLERGERCLNLAEKLHAQNSTRLAKRYFKRAIAKFRKRVEVYHCPDAFNGIARALEYLDPNTSEKQHVDEIVALYQFKVERNMALSHVLNPLVVQYRQEYC